MARLVQSLGGPKALIRRLLTNRIQSKILYKAAVWTEALGREAYGRNLQSGYMSAAHKSILDNRRREPGSLGPF